MADNSSISWTDTTWQPVVGCTRISPGCRGCYAARMAKRQAGMARAKRAKGQDPGRSAHYEKVENWDGVALVPEALGDPLKWRKARRVFVCSMADLFHEDVPTRFIHRIFETMRKSPQHTFQVLTKRPHRMKDFVAEYRYRRLMETGPPNHDRRAPELSRNIWLGVTAEDQQRADERIPLLLQTPAAFRFVSLEPLLSDIRFHSRWLSGYHYESGPLAEDIRRVENNSLNLAIVGGETGPGARPLHPAWARSLRDQCADAGVPFHFKSWGEWLHESQFTNGAQREKALSCKRRDAGDGFQFVRVGAKAAGHLLDGVEHRDL